ncbi:hypothetical protein [Brucella pituitosa]|uniref:hypothetical protein n=1 Tax=Brucella pituitosa TaxID=571256 RepID=UPI003F4AA57A
MADTTVLPGREKTYHATLFSDCVDLIPLDLSAAIMGRASVVATIGAAYLFATGEIIKALQDIDGFLMF